MTTVTAPTHGGLRWQAADALVMARRNLLRYVRLPQLLVFATVQPIMFVVLFAYVFGGAIDIPGVDYLDFLLPGILVQTVIFGSTQTGLGLADDLGSGAIDRFRSLPMARSAVLAGRTLADTGRTAATVLLIAGVGAVLGFRIHTGLLPALAGVAVALLFGHAFSWVSATIGLLAKDPETAQVAGTIWMFPVVFASSAFVPVDTMPTWLQTFAAHQPITVTVDALRALVLGGPTAAAVLQSLAWSSGILAVFVPLAIARYRRLER